MNSIGGFAPETITGDYYYDPEIFEREKEQIFCRTWQYTGHVSMLPSPSTYIVREIADESIIIMRDRNDEYRAYFNVCQHRAHRLLEGEGKLRPVITCPYHAWAYGQDGKLRGAPGTEEIDSFDKSKICLKSVRLEMLCGFIFVNLDPNALSLRDLTPGLEEEIRALSPNPESLQVSNRSQVELAANWKNSIENYSECYHCPTRHPTLSQNALDMTSYKIECHENFHIHRSQDKGEDVGYTVDTEKAAKPHEFRSFYIWPNTVFEVYPGGNLTLFHHMPSGPETTVQKFEWYFSSAELTQDEQDLVKFLNVVRMEDVPICESVQKGLHSRGYGKGRLVVDAGRTYRSEHAVHNFQKKVIAALG
jgi:choline monooxygenase